MRVTNSMLVSNFLNNLNTNMNKLNKLQDQMATNKKYAHVSDDPISVIYSQQANYKLKRLAQYQSNVNHAIEWNKQVETSMMDFNKIMKSAYEACIGAGTDYKTKSDMQKDAEYIKQLRDQLITTLNSTFGDKYVFGGYNNTGYVSENTGKLVAPFSASEDGKTLLFNGVPVNDIVSGNFREPFTAAEIAALPAMLSDIEAGTYNPASYLPEEVAALDTLLGEISAGKFDDSAFTKEEALRLQKLAQDIVAGTQYEKRYTGTTAYSDLAFVAVGDPTLQNMLSSLEDGSYNPASHSAAELTALGDLLQDVIGGNFNSGSYTATQMQDLQQLANDIAGSTLNPADYDGTTAFADLAALTGTPAAMQNMLAEIEATGSYSATSYTSAEVAALDTLLQNVTSGNFDSGPLSDERTQRLTHLAQDIVAGTHTNTHYAGTTAYADLAAAMGGTAEQGYSASMIDGLKTLASDTLSFDIGPGISMDANYNGINLVTVGDTNLYEILNNLYETLMFEGQEAVTDASGNVLQEGKDATTADDVNLNIKILQDGQSRILSALAEIGGRTNRLEMMESRYEQDELAYFQMKSDAEDADQSEVIMNAKMAEAVYKAALSTGATIIQPTLMDFLR